MTNCHIMNTKSFHLQNLQGKNAITISSTGLVIDFLKHFTHIEAYVGGDKTSQPSNFHAEVLIIENNQPHGKSFNIPVKSNEMLIEITTYSDYDVNLLLADPV